MNVTIDTEPLSEVVGLRVNDIDLRDPLHDETKAILQRLLAEKCVLCFPKQEISAEDQCRFANIFGRADGGPRDRSAGNLKSSAKRGVMFVTNIRENGVPIGSLPDGEMQFHSDGAHRDYPYRATTLFGIKIPPLGGNTLFANLQVAYDMLSPEMKGQLKNL